MSGRLYRVVRHLGDGARIVLTEGLALTDQQVEKFNRVNARTMYRCWPVTELSPLLSDTVLSEP